MTDREILRAAMKKRDYNQVILASEMGYGSQSSIAERLRCKQSMRCDIFVKFMDFLGFDVVIRSRRADKTEWILSFDKGTGESQKEGD